MNRPRHLLALFLLITLAPSALLLVFGWRILRQDEELQTRQALQRLEQMADLAASNLSQSLEAVRLRLESPDSFPESPGAAVIMLKPGSVRGRLLFYPFTVAGQEAPPTAFLEGERMERNHQTSEAIAWFAQLAQKSPQASVRAGALIREARSRQNVGQSKAALTVLNRAAEERGAAVVGVPSDLFAQWMACEILESMGASAELAARAAALHADLLSGKWRLNRATFEVHENDASRWMGKPSIVPGLDVALASAAEWLWAQPQTPRGQTAMAFNGIEMTLLWSNDGERMTALIAGPDYVRQQWFSRLPGVRLNVNEGVQRSAAQSGLPWNIGIERGAIEQPPGRQRLWIAGLLIIAALVIAGTYLIARAAAHELAVARLQGDFVAAVSHEFRTPLTSLRQLTEVLRDGRVASEDRRQTYYDVLARQTERLHQLVESLLDFGRMEAGRSPYRLEPMDAGAWIRSVVEQFGNESSARGYQVALDASVAPSTIVADVSAMTNALWNLLENAVKYSPDCRTVWVSATRENSWLAVRVRDQGLGIPLDEQKQIFHKFVRGSSAKALSIQGTGIGLAMVDHIVSAHGGEVHLESQPGSGSTFTILLPCQES